MSNAPEFVPWVIQPTKERNFSEFGAQAEAKNAKADAEWAPANLAEESQEASLEEENNVVAPNGNNQPEAPDEASLAKDAEVIDPDLLPKFTPVEYKEHGEAEYLRGYNACKENESSYRFG